MSLPRNPIKDLPIFKFWCQKVLPLVYDQSLSYYEVLCKVVDYINHLIEDDKILLSQIEVLQGEMKVVQQWIIDARIEWVHDNINNINTAVADIKAWIESARIEWVHDNINALNTHVAEIDAWIEHANIDQVHTDILELFNSVKNINNWIDDFDGVTVKADISTLKDKVAALEKWVDDFDTSYAEEIIRDHLATMIFVEINDSGYIVYNIPEQWSDITFNTTGLDIILPLQPEYGHLVLSY